MRSNPYLGKKLHGKFKSFYVLRSWPYRVVYEADEQQKMVTIIRIRHRKDFYK
ncbi:type II toxin-antitoxin system RelE/ParE family toxin [Patescibacteria group bacterium]|nr:type II toxin-antitoxin system RelE/ParE family toxin [Patescibacteria group bacterium]